MNGLYHKEIWLPVETEKFHGKPIVLEYSNHAKRACISDRYGIIRPPLQLTPTKDNVIEVEMTDGKVTKILIRQKYDQLNDILIAFIPRFAGGFVKTFWLNRSDDLHRTLDRSKYKSK